MNYLDKIVSLPSTLVVLDCSENKLTSLPALPQTMQELMCASNQLKTLPSLPSGLKSLWCSFNKIRKLPSLPNGLSYFYANDNEIGCLPILPKGIEFGGLSNNPISCIPSEERWMENEIVSLPICEKSIDEKHIDCYAISEGFENSSIQHFKFNGNTNLNENEIVVYPNPTDGKVTVASKNCLEVITIKDIEGKTIKELTPLRNTIEIDLSDLINGIYFIQTSLKEDIKVHKIIKTN